MRQETELLWSEYANQCSHFSQLRGDSSLEQERAELLELWRSQQTDLQRRGSSLGAALRQIDSTENHLVDFNDRLDRYLRQSKDITGFSLASTNILKDIKVCCQYPLSTFQLCKMFGGDMYVFQLFSQVGAGVPYQNSHKESPKSKYS